MSLAERIDQHYNNLRDLNNFDLLLIADSLNSRGEYPSEYSSEEKIIGYCADRLYKDKELRKNYA